MGSGAWRPHGRPAPRVLWYVLNAIARLRAQLGSVPDGAELARETRLQLRHDEPFGPIVLHPTPGGEDMPSPGAGQPARAV